jgi:cytochrome c biogenesis protein CcdA
MESLLIDIGAAFWLGILTSISPCPLSTNIAAVSYVGRSVVKTRSVLFSGLLYALGRTFAYCAVAILVTQSLQMIPGISMFLQKYINLVMGPLLIVVSMVLLGIFNLWLSGGIGNKLQKRVDRMGIWGAGFLGIVFALAFCPVSAGLFFGALIPLALKHNAVLMSIIYGTGTAIPVIGFAFILAFSTNLLGTVFKKLTAIEIWVRRTTAAVMIAVGIYLILRHNFGFNI